MPEILTSPKARRVKTGALGKNRKAADEQTMTVQSERGGYKPSDGSALPPRSVAGYGSPGTGVILFQGTLNPGHTLAADVTPVAGATSVFVTGQMSGSFLPTATSKFTCVCIFFLRTGRALT